MIVRRAGLGDLSDMVAWGKDAHARSNYATCAPFNAAITRAYFKSAIGQPDNVLLVAKDGGVRGLLLGVADNYPFSHVRFATDVLFVADAGGGELLDAFEAWARARKVQMIESAPSQDRFAALHRLFRRKGFVRHGGTFRKDLRGDA